MSPSDRLVESHDDQRERIYLSATGSHDGRRTLLSGALALVVFLLLLALSTRQVTAPAQARRLIESGIASTTDIDRLIAENQPTLVQLTESSPSNGFAIPGYPLNVYLARNEVSLPPAQLRAVILSRSSTLVYEQGISAFDRTGSQSFSRFSSQGLLDFLAGQVSARAYDRASSAAVVLTIVLALVSGAVLVANDGWSRLRVLGIAVLAGAAPVAFLSGVAWLIAGRAGGSDPYVLDLRDLARAVLTVPFRDALVVAIAGLVLVLSGAAFGYLARRAASDEAAALPDLVGAVSPSLDPLAEE